MLACPRNQRGARALPRRGQMIERVGLRKVYRHATASLEQASETVQSRGIALRGSDSILLELGRGTSRAAFVARTLRETFAGDERKRQNQTGECRPVPHLFPPANKRGAQTARALFDVVAVTAPTLPADLAARAG